MFKDFSVYKHKESKSAILTKATVRSLGVRHRPVCGSTRMKRSHSAATPSLPKTALSSGSQSTSYLVRNVSMEMAATSRSMTRSTGSISDFLEQIHEYRLDKVPLCLTVDNHYSHYSIEVYRKLKDLNMVLEYTPSASCIFNSC